MNLPAPDTHTAPPGETPHQNIEDVLAIIRLMAETDLAELEIEAPQLKLCLKRTLPASVSSAPTVEPAMSAPRPPVAIERPHPVAIPTSAQRPVAKPDVPAVSKSHKVVSPMAGTFYRAPSPTAAPYVKEGDVVTLGQTVCIVEAMKLMNEIKSDKAGRVVKIPLANAAPVEKGSVLVEIEPD